MKLERESFLKGLLSQKVKRLFVYKKYMNAFENLTYNFNIAVLGNVIHSNEYKLKVEWLSSLSKKIYIPQGKKQGKFSSLY